jgi:hypothetical protein
MRAFSWLAGILSVFVACADSAWAQQQSPLLLPSMPVMKPGDKPAAGTASAAPIADPKGGAGPQRPADGRSVEPPRTPVPAKRP